VSAVNFEWIKDPENRNKANNKFVLLVCVNMAE